MLLRLLIFGAVIGWGGLLCFPQTTECKVSGMVEARFGGIEPNVTITFTSGGISKNVTSDKEGAYSVLLSPGIYEITLSRMSKLRYKRARAAISCPNELGINIYTLPECVSYGCQRSGYNFSSFLSNWTRNRSLNLVIAFDSKKVSGKVIEYDAAMLTYDKYTLSADKIVQDANSKSLVAEGHGWIEDGRRRRVFQKLNLTFGENGLQIKGLETQAARWTSADPYRGSSSQIDPQSFNRYSYVTNDPLNSSIPMDFMRAACIKQ